MAHQTLRRQGDIVTVVDDELNLFRSMRAARR